MTQAASDAVALCRVWDNCTSYKNLRYTASVSPCQWRDRSAPDFCVCSVRLSSFVDAAKNAWRDGVAVPVSVEGGGR